ncbi:hypothetical protein GCM10008012_25880 [Rhizobium anhuiense]|uniref:Uncharacterized protein n=1 Tax=Rhizobium anhuiense TaxID=1184720 RepID=A0A432NRJ6_9HYPH|nr:hypothetical protein EEQ99_13240 [Rhizobium anhuiense]GGD80868.1 hypothetical protein GCM10008012_25880 [Rhizobium anhuiense]
MSANIMSAQTPSTSARLKRGGSRASKLNQPLVAPRPQDDPALIIGLALAFARQGSSKTRAIPSVLLDRLRHHARFGEPTCRLVLDCLDRRAGANRRTAARQGVPSEIVSVHPVKREGR